MRTGFETLSSKQDQTIDEIKLMRGDLQSYRDGEVEQINVLRAHGMSDVSN